MRRLRAQRKEPPGCWIANQRVDVQQLSHVSGKNDNSKAFSPKTPAKEMISSKRTYDSQDDNAQVHDAEQKCPIDDNKKAKLTLDMSSSEISAGSSMLLHHGEAKKLSKDVLEGCRPYLLSKIRANQQQVVLLVRVTNKWMRKIHKPTGTSDSLVATFIDSKGDEIQARVLHSNLTKWDQILTIGNTLVLKSITIKKHQFGFRIVPHDFMIDINDRSIAIQVEDDKTIPYHVHHLTPLDKISSLGAETQILIDAAGIIWKLESRSMSTYTRISLYIVDQSKCFVRLTVWNEIAKKYDDDLVIAAKQNDVLLATKVKIDRYNDEFCVATTDYSDLSLQPNDPEFQILKKWLSMEKIKGKLPTVARPYNKKQIENTTQLMTINDVLLHAQKVIEKALYLTIKVMIRSVSSDDEIFFECCQSCSKKYKLASGSTRCYHCGVINCVPITRLKIKAKILDESGDAYATLFGENANSFLGVSTERLLEHFSKDESEDAIDQIFAEPVGKIYTFHLRLSKDNQRYIMNRDFTIASFATDPLQQ